MKVEGDSALERGFRVLDCFAAAQGPLGNGEVSQQTGIPRATVSRLIATLVGLGHLRAARGGDKYEMAAGVVRLAQAFLGAIDVRQYARPHLAALSEASGASSFIGVRDGDDMLVVEAARARSAVVMLGADIGTRMAIVSSALGRAWLAAVDETTRRALVDRWRTQPDRAAMAGPHLDKALAASLRQGFAISVGEWHPNIHAVAVPIRTASGEVISLNCGGAAFVLPEDRLRKVVVPLVLRAARALADDIGGAPGFPVPAIASPGRRPITVAP